MGQEAPSTRITPQPCLGQPDTPAHWQQHSPGCPPIGQGASPPPKQAAACDLSPRTLVSASRANRLAPRDRAAWVSFFLQRVARPWKQALSLTCSGRDLWGRVGSWWWQRGLAVFREAHGSRIPSSTSWHTLPQLGWSGGKNYRPCPPPLQAQARPWLPSPLPLDNCSFSCPETPSPSWSPAWASSRCLSLQTSSPRPRHSAQSLVPSPGLLSPISPNNHRDSLSSSPSAISVLPPSLPPALLLRPSKDFPSQGQ